MLAASSVCVGGMNCSKAGGASVTQAPDLSARTPTYCGRLPVNDSKHYLVILKNDKILQTHFKIDYLI